MTEKDFQKMEHNPIALKEGELMKDKYPYFSKRDIFSESLFDRQQSEPSDEGVLMDDRDDDKCLSDLIKFVVLYCAIDSPYWDDENFDLRAEGCIKWAKIKKTDRAYFHITQQTHWLDEIITEYFVYINFDKYEEWHSCKASYRSQNAYLRMPFSDDPEKTSKAHIEIQKNLRVIRANIDKLQAELFPKDKRAARRIQEAIDNKESVVGYAEKKALYSNN